MKPYLTGLFIFILVRAGHAQWEIRGLSPETDNHGQMRSIEVSGTPLDLPFWEDFSTDYRIPDTLWVAGDSVFINTSSAIDPPTYQVATFDGLNHLGSLYSETAIFPDVGDRLISRPIRLAGLNAGNNVFLSFYWQAGGNGEIPNEGDAFRLAFKNTDDEWITVWERYGGITGTDQFTQEIIQLTDASFFHNDFQFRFESFGSLQGPFDTWNLDYIYLDRDRNDTDTTYFDRAMTGSLSSFISPYREMPAKRFFSNPNRYIQVQSYQGSNLDETLHTLVVDYELKILNNEQTYAFTDGDKFFREGEQKTETLDEVPSIAAQSSLDSAVLVFTVGSNFGDNTAPIDFTVNDVITDTIRLTDAYAYDDGVAEFVGGISQNNGMVAVEYIIDTLDRLNHFDIYFPSTVPLSQGQTIELMVWDSLEADSTLLTQRYVIPASQGRDKFVRIPLVKELIVQDTFFIGYRQKTSNYIGIGVDRNNQSAMDRMWFRVNQSWQQNENLRGVLMMRPVFANDSSTILGVGKVHSISDFQVYPNPSRGRFSINGNYKKIRLWDSNGLLLHEEKAKSLHDLYFLPQGLYLLEIETPNFRLIQKIIFEE